MMRSLLAIAALVACSGAWASSKYAIKDFDPMGTLEEYEQYVSQFDRARYNFISNPEYAKKSILFSSEAGANVPTVGGISVNHALWEEYKLGREIRLVFFHEDQKPPQCSPSKTYLILHSVLAQNFGDNFKPQPGTHGFARWEEGYDRLSIEVKKWASHCATLVEIYRGENPLQDADYDDI